MKRTIYDNYYLCDTYTDNDMIELARANGMIEEDETLSDSILWELRAECDREEWEETKAQLDKYFEGKTVIYFGSVGHWDGLHQGGKVGDFEELFYKAVKDCDYIKIEDNNGALLLTCSHHDGTNIFEIKEVTEKGIDYFDRWQYGTDKRTEREAHEQIIRRYSRRPHFWQHVYC